MARISTYPIDTNVIGLDRWIGSDWNTEYKTTKNFTADAVAAYFNKASAIDTGQFSWNFVAYSSTVTQYDKTFSLVGYTNTSIGINQLEGILKVSFLTLANTTPGTFIAEQWINKIILVHIPNNPSSYGLYRITNISLVGDFYYLTTDLQEASTGTILANTPVSFGIYDGVSGTNGTSGSSGTSGTSGTAGTSGYSGDKYRGTSTTTFTLGNAGSITTQTALSYTAAQSIIVVYNANNFQECEVISYNSNSGLLTFAAPTRTVGSGTYSSWSINLDGASGGDGSSGTSGTAGSSGSSGISGTSGINGTNGTSGFNGSSGTTGTSGTSGLTGTSGTSGQNGISAGRTYYFNQSQSSDISPYKVLAEQPSGAAQQIITQSGIGAGATRMVSEFLTPELGFVVIPSGAQRFHFHFLKDANANDFEAYATLELANSSGTGYGTILTTGASLINWIDSSTPVEVTVDLTLPTTGILATDRMIVKIYVRNIGSGSHNIKWYTEGISYYSYVLTSVGAVGGTSGTSGTSGITGTSGTNGTSGVNGTSGSSGLSYTTYAETPIGSIDGANTTFVITNVPVNSQSVIVLLDGVTQYSGIDFTISSNVITFVSAPASGSTIFAYYNFISGLTINTSWSVASTYAAMLAISTPTNLLIVKVLNDENKGIANTIYYIYPDGVRMWIAATRDN